MSLNLAVLLHEAARQRGVAPAIVADERQLSHRELLQQAQACAGALRAAGLRHGEHVALLLPNVPEFTVCYFGAHHTGMPVVPLNILLTAEEIAYHLADGDAAALIVWSELLGPAQAAFAQVAGCRQLLVVGPGSDRAPAPATDLTAAIASTAPVTDLPDTRPDDTAVILYTSGTTGRPKGAELSHFNLLFNAHVMVTRQTPIGPDSVCLVALPLFHSFGQTVLQNAHLAAGGTLVLMRRFEAAAAFRLLTTHRVTYFAGVPTMYFALLHDPAAADFDARHLRFCVSGGAPMPVDVMRNFDTRFGVDVLEGYGLSETSPVISFNGHGQPKVPGSIGRPIWGIEFRLIDEAGGPVTETGARGEICVKGHAVMKGYYKQPAATAAALRDGWFRTGDVATRDPDGNYFIVDRVKDMILRGGFNVYPREIEEVLYRHPAVAEAAVIGRPDEELGEEVVACLALRPGATVGEAEIIAFCREHLAAYKYPRAVRFLPELPKGPTGKILKRALRAH